MSMQATSQIFPAPVKPPTSLPEKREGVPPRETVKDRVEIEDQKTVAKAGEGRQPQKKTLSPHDALKNGKNRLEGILKKIQKGNFSQKEFQKNPLKYVHLVLEGGGSPALMAELNVERNAYQTLQVEVMTSEKSLAGETPTGVTDQTIKKGLATDDVSTEKRLEDHWIQLEKIGLGDPSRNTSTASHKIQFLRRQETVLSKEIKAKVEELKELRKKAEASDATQGKDQAKKAFEALKTEVEGLLLKQTALHQATVQGEELLENILKLETEKDLGLSGDAIPEEVGLLKTSSAGRDEISDESFDDSGDTGGKAGFVPNTPLLGIANDHSGTTFQIMAESGNLKAEAKKTDKIIQQLLQAVLSGNAEAIAWALILLDKRASQVTTGIAAQTIKAMQAYEKQIAALSGSIAKLKGTEPDYGAKLQKINSEMNMYSLNRQAIANFLRDAMSMREEIMNMTKSYLDARTRLTSRASQ